MKKTAFWIFTVTSIFIASFKSALAAPATSSMGTVINMIFDLVTPIFNAFTQTNGQGIILIKFVLWLLLFTVLYQLASAIPIFKGRKGAAGTVAVAIALISVAMIPDLLVTTIAYEYSGIATFIFFVAPIVCLFWLNKKIPDSPSGDIIKFLIYFAMAVLAWTLSAKVQSLNVPFLKDMVGSQWWVLFSTIVSIAAAWFFYKFVRTTFAGAWVGEKAAGARGWFSRAPKVNQALTPTPAGPAPEEQAAAQQESAVQQALTTLSKITDDAKIIDERKKAVSDNQLKEADELINHLGTLQKILPNINSYMGAIEVLNKPGTTITEETRNKAQSYQAQLEGLNKNATAELQRVNTVFNNLQKELYDENNLIDKEAQEISEIRNTIMTAGKSVDNLIGVKNMQVGKDKKALEEAGKNGAAPEAIKLKENTFAESQRHLEVLKSVKVGMPLIAEQASRTVQKIEQVKKLISQLQGFLNADIAALKEAMDVANKEIGGYSKATEMLGNVINMLKNQKLLISQKDELSITDVPQLKSELENYRNQLAPVLYIGGKKGSMSWG